MLDEKVKDFFLFRFGDIRAARSGDFVWYFRTLLVGRYMPEFEWFSPAKTWRMVETEVIRIINSTRDCAPMICSGTGEEGMAFE